MRKVTLATFVVICAISAACSDSSRPHLLSPGQVATTPSAESDRIKVAAIKVGENLADVTLSENLSYGFRAGEEITDWNSANVYVVKKCDGKESQSGSEYSNSADPTTGKRTLLLPRIATCGGNLLNIRIRAEAYGGGGMKNFTFPDSSRVFLSNGLTLVRDGDFTYIRGTLN